jgi:hypothetical protein
MEGKPLLQDSLCAAHPVAQNTFQMPKTPIYNTVKIVQRRGTSTGKFKKNSVAQGIWEA